MRKLLLSMMVSLDGMIARADGDLSWFRSDEQFETEMLPCGVVLLRYHRERRA